MTNESNSLTSVFENTSDSVFSSLKDVFIYITNFVTVQSILKIIISIIFVILFFVIYKVTKKSLSKLSEEKISLQKKTFIQKICKYFLFFLSVIIILSMFGIKLSAIWGAAGVAGVALGFAAQTSVSNLISGIFVITEGSLKIGDIIVVDNITGIIDSINLLSVRIHTFDNQMVRIPNSTIINKNLVNNSYHSKRRMTISVDISYNTDMNKALETIKQVPEKCSLVLTDPAPNAWFEKFGESGITLILAVWFNKDDLINVKNQVFIAIKQVFDNAGIEIPYNKIDVYLKSKL